jgi:hypothetical protein
VPDTRDRPHAHLPGKRVTVSVLGALQILSWGSTFYLPGVLAGPIARDTAWPYDQVVAGLWFLSAAKRRQDQAPAK